MQYTDYRNILKYISKKFRRPNFYNKRTFGKTIKWYITDEFIKKFNLKIKTSNDLSKINLNKIFQSMCNLILKNFGEEIVKDTSVKIVEAFPHWWSITNKRYCIIVYFYIDGKV
jgi:hypothetical protein